VRAFFSHEFRLGPPPFDVARHCRRAWRRGHGRGYLRQVQDIAPHDALVDRDLGPHADGAEGTAA
jgi:hypothetical protein